MISSASSSFYADHTPPLLTNSEVKQIAKQYYLKKSTVRKAEAEGKLDRTHLAALSALITNNQVGISLLNEESI